MSETKKRRPSKAPAVRLPPVDRSRDLVDELKTSVTTVTEALVRANARARTFERLVHVFEEGGSEEAALDKVLDVAMEAVPCEAGSVFLVEPDGNSLRIAAARGPVADRARGLRIEMGHGLAGVCAMFKQTIPVSDVASDSRFEKDVAEALGYPARSVLAAPILHAGEVVGVIEIINRKDGDVFHSTDIELVEKTGRAAGRLLSLFRERR